MPRHLSTITPENVSIEYELAGFASRCAAAFIDLFVLIVGIVVMLLLYIAIATIAKLSVTGWLTAVAIILGFLWLLGYFVWYEAAWNGQTPGKKLLGLRVVRYGGTPVDWSCAALRGLVRVIDLIIFLIGAILILLTPRNQRLGDFAAGTLVVKERAQWLGDLQPTAAIPTVEYPESDLVRNVELVTPEQFDMAKRFVERAAELEPQSKEQVASRIAVPLMQHLGIEDRPGIIYSNLVSAIYNRCVTERGLR